MNIVAQVLPDVAFSYAFPWGGMAAFVLLLLLVTAVGFFTRRTAYFDIGCACGAISLWRNTGDICIEGVFANTWEYFFAVFPLSFYCTFWPALGWTVFFGALYAILVAASQGPRLPSRSAS
jgi:hypothetical protein